MAQSAVTGKSETPMIVITTPVTTGGKNLSSLAKNGAMMMPMAPEASTAPNTAGMPPPPLRMAIMVATPEKEVPWTSGSWAPKNGTPRVCRMVARPPMNRQLATSTPISAVSMPAAPPITSGGAMMPPYMVSTCWKP